MKKIIVIALLILSSISANAQINGQKVDTKKKYVTALPATCTLNDGIIYVVISTGKHSVCGATPNTFVEITNTTSGGTVTSISVTTANGVSASCATCTTTPALTFTLGAITPSTINGNTFTAGTGTITLAASKTFTSNDNITLASDGTGTRSLNIAAGGTLGTAAFTAAGAYEVPLTFSTGLIRTTNTIIVDQTSAFTPTWPGLHTHAIDSANTNTVVTLGDIQASSSGTVAANFGLRKRYGLETTTTANQDAAAVDVTWTTATHASRTSQLDIKLVNSAAALASALQVGPASAIFGGSINVTQILNKSATATSILFGSSAHTISMRTNGTARMTFGTAGGLTLETTNTAAGTTGAQTIDKMSGAVNFAASATTLVVTNSLVTAASMVFCTIQTNDATATIKNCTPASGSFTITLTAAATAETRVAFWVIN